MTFLSIIQENPSILIILFIAIILFFCECFSIINYISTSDFNLARKAIDFLEENKNNVSFVFNRQNYSLFNWIKRHLLGKVFELEFQPQRENELFVLMSFPAIFNKSIPRSPVYFAPILLTALGILGTFSGIFFGLQKIGINNIQTTEYLLEASTELLSGMKVAFSTSLFGLGSASLMIVVLAIGNNLRKRARNKLRKRFSDIAFLPSIYHVLSNSNNSYSTNNLTSINIADTLEKVFASDDSLLLKELKKQTKILDNLQQLNLENSQQKTQESIVNSINVVIEELQRLQTIQKKQQSDLKLLIEEFRNKLIEPITDKLEKSSIVTQESSQTIKELKNELAQMSVNLVGAVNTIQQFQQDTLLKLQEFADNLDHILNKFGNDTKKVLTEICQEVYQVLGESLQAVEKQKEVFETNVNQTSQTFEDVSQDLQKALEVQGNQQEKTLREITNSTEDILVKTKEIFRQQGNNINSVVSACIETMERQRENFQENIEQTVDVFMNIREDLQEILQVNSQK